ncbi:MAG: V4R domain-containing protein [Thermoplasmata archaeon]
MKFIKMSQKELHQIARFYEGVMATAYEGLFYREGKVIGSSIIEMIDTDDNMMGKAEKLVQARGWVISLKLEEGVAYSDGSVEVDENAGTKTCHRLRGILSSIYEKKTGDIVDIKEIKCQSLGDERCEFEVKIKGF